MDPEKTILDIAREFNLPLSAKPIQSQNDPQLFQIFSRRAVTRREQASIQSKLSDKGLRVIIENPSIEDEFEQALKSSLSEKFKDHVDVVGYRRNVESTSISVIYTANDKFSSEMVSDHINALADLFDVSINLSIGERALTPSLLQFMQLVRISAPTNCEQMQDLIVSRGYPVPPESWINHQFDNLRKKGFVSRREDRTYVFTDLGLSALGSSKSRNSPDIRRVLEMNRAKG